MFNSPHAGPEDRCVLTPSQQQVVDLLSQGATVTAAARSVSVHRNTVSNWRRSSPPFRAALTGAVEETTRLRRQQIAALLPTALETLRAVLVDATISPGLRLKAALAILDRAAGPPSPDLITTAKSLVTSSPEPEKVHKVHNPDPARPSQPLVTLSSETKPVHNVHNSAQPHAKNEHSKPSLTPVRPTPKPGRNHPCPCGSPKEVQEMLPRQSPAAAVPHRGTEANSALTPATFSDTVATYPMEGVPCSA